MAGIQSPGGQASGSCRFALTELQHLVLELDQVDQVNQATEKNASNLSREDLLKTYEWIQYDWLWGQGYTLPQ